MAEIKLPSIMQDFIKSSAIPMVRLNLSSQTTDFTPNTASKLGGLGYLPQGENYPTYNNQPLQLLVQINFAELAQQVDLTQLKQSLPKQGILQIYIYAFDDNYWYSADFDNPYPSETYQVRFWQDTDQPLNIEVLNQIKNQFIQLDSKKAILPFDLKKEYPIQFELQQQACSKNCYEFNHQATGDLSKYGVWGYFEDILEIDDPYEYIQEYEILANVAVEAQMLGYPNFTQTDPREYTKDLRQHILLLQIDSDDDLDICWGDCGIANFFIHPNDLAKADFSRLVYNWDCY